MTATSRPAGAHIVGRFPLEGPEDAFRTMPYLAPYHSLRLPEATAPYLGVVDIADGGLEPRLSEWRRKDDPGKRRDKPGSR